MNNVNIWLGNLGLKTNICPFLIHFMQSNASLIKKLLMHINFIGKTPHSVERAKLTFISVFILPLIEVWTICGPQCSSCSAEAFEIHFLEQKKIAQVNRYCIMWGSLVLQACLRWEKVISFWGGGESWSYLFSPVNRHKVTKYLIRLNLMTWIFSHCQFS